MKIHENDVYIFVHDEHGQPLDVSQWSITFPRVPGDNYPKGANDRERLQPVVLAQISNVILLRYYAGRSKTEHVAITYMNRVHGTNVSSDEWPADHTVIDVHDERRSSGMSVTGDFEAPHKLNFYFEVSLKTPAGFVMDLVLAQGSSGHGLLRKLVHIGEAATHFVKAGVAAAEEDDLESLKQTEKFIKDLKKIEGENHNPWYVAIKGTPGWPSVNVEEHSGGKKRSLLFVGPVGTANVPARMQAGRFYYYRNDRPAEHQYYTFNLELYDDRPYDPQLALQGGTAA